MQYVILTSVLVEKLPKSVFFLETARFLSPEYFHFFKIKSMKAFVYQHYKDRIYIEGNYVGEVFNILNYVDS